VLSVESSLASHPPGPTFYRPNVALIYVHYEVLTRNYTGWTLSEQKQMSHREREYWLAMIKWRASARAQGMQ